MKDSSGSLLLTGLTILFTYLKLTGQIDWSWIWVVSPLWIPLAIVLGVIAFILLIGAVVSGIALLVGGILGLVAILRGN